MLLCMNICIFKKKLFNITLKNSQCCRESILGALIAPKHSNFTTTANAKVAFMVLLAIDNISIHIAFVK